MKIKITFSHDNEQLFWWQNDNVSLYVKIKIAYSILFRQNTNIFTISPNRGKVTRWVGGRKYEM